MHKGRGVGMLHTDKQTDARKNGITQINQKITGDDLNKSKLQQRR